MVKLAEEENIEEILEVINDAKAHFKAIGSSQWQDTDGYPNRDTMLKDIKRNECYVCYRDNKIVGVIVLSSIQEEPYKFIYDGNWATQDFYYVIHRIACRKEYYHSGVASELMAYVIDIAKNNHICAIKADTKEDNYYMHQLLIKFNFEIRGKINILRSGCLEPMRIAYELTLNK